MKDYGEPWVLENEDCGAGFIDREKYRRGGSSIETGKRIVDCVNALRGYDPGAVRDAVKAFERAVKEADMFDANWAQAITRDDLKSALAALKKDKS